MADLEVGLVRTQRTTWVFTLNNPTEAECEALVKWADDQGEKLSVCVVGKEKGMEGTPHLQGAIRWRRGKRFADVKRLLPRAHWEAARVRDPFTYCRKQHNLLIDIDTRKQGKRTDLAAAVDALRSGGGMAAVISEHPEVYVKYHKGMKELARMDHILSIKKRKMTKPWKFKITDWNREEQCLILCGKTGVGKTEFAMDQFENALLVRQKDDLKLFIHGLHDGIVFDDTHWLGETREEQIKILDLNRDTTVHCRFTNAVIPAKIPRIFTTNVIKGWIFSLEDPAIERRCKVTQYVEEPMWREPLPVVAEDEDDDDDTVCVPETPPQLTRQIAVVPHVVHPARLRAPPVEIDLTCSDDEM